VSAERIQVKICGLRDAASARVAVEAGADALGFILAPSKRQVIPERVRRIRQDVADIGRALPPLVGVVVNATPVEIASYVATSGVDMVQLSGDESPAIMDEIDVPVIRALRFAVGTSVDDARRAIHAWLDRSRPATWLLVEGHAQGSYGGTGTLADWGLAASLAGEVPIWLAGGLRPGTVGEAIRQVRPVGVDVSSGVETHGMKDAHKIRDFVQNAQRAGESSAAG
jgi:phosphoribosylanthranilate isomerase